MNEHLASIPTTQSNTEKATDHTSIASAVTRLVEILSPLAAEERDRAILAMMSIFGQTAPDSRPVRAASLVHNAISPKASAWLRRNNVTLGELENIFSIDESGVAIIASAMPGRGKREQTVQAYLMCGLCAFLSSGEPQFSDEAARKLCEDFGCLDRANHTKIYGQFGNRITGSRETAWKLTTPGLIGSAEVVKALQ